jgi:rRNA maturation protein Nop10
MKDECPHCGSGRTVPVLDVRMRGQPHGGNPYRARCLGCDRWLPMASKEDFKNHLHPHVLRKDADPDADDCTIPLEDWDRADDYQEVLKRLERYRDRERPYEIATDGDGTDETEQQAERTNNFACPACDEERTGYPDRCPDCGATYNWN